MDNFEKFEKMINQQLEEENNIKLGGIKFPRKLCPPKNSPDKDIWMTPTKMAQDIVRYFSPSGEMIEPCMGDGSPASYKKIFKD